VVIASADHIPLLLDVLPLLPLLPLVPPLLMFAGIPHCARSASVGVQPFEQSCANVSGPHVHVPIPVFDAQSHSISPQVQSSA
jgi:hypothetical protein